MIYLDNAATTCPKPPEVAQTVAAAIEGFGNVGRGAHEAALDAGCAVHRAREAVARLLGAPSATRVAFSANATEALNIAIEGLLGPSDHAVTTAASHNSVLRPLYRKHDTCGMGLSIVEIAADGTLDLDAFEAAFQPNTRAAVVTHASNLTGTLYDVAALARICHAHGALCIVDTAQTAGSVPIDMTAADIDVLCFTGHKGLYGPQGTGGLCVAEGVEVAPFKVGGTGIRSYDRTHPATMPDSLEAGTINAHGIAGLAAGVAFIEAQGGPKAIGARTHALAAACRTQLAAIEGVTLYGRAEDAPNSSIIAFNVGELDSAEVADLLARDYGIATRAGAHCAPLMHRALGTSERGAVRASFGYFNTEQDAAALAAAVADIAQIAAES